MNEAVISRTFVRRCTHHDQVLSSRCSIIDDQQVRQVIELVDSSPLPAQVAEWRELDRRGPGGRPAKISFRALVVGLILASLEGTTNLTQVHAILFKRISSQMFRELDLPYWRFKGVPRVHDHHWDDATYRNVVDAFSRLIALMDPSLLPKNRVMDGPDFELLISQWTPRCRVEPAIARQRLHWFANQILEISFRTLPRETRRKWNGSIAIDGTPIGAFARPDRRIRGPKSRLKRELVRSSADPDAGFYIRTGDHAGDRSNESPSKMSWAYESTIAITVHDDPSTAAPFPHLVAGMSVLDRPGSEPGRQAVSVLDSIVDRGHPAQWLVVDNLFPNQKPEKFQDPARDLGYEPVFEYTSGQQGVVEEFHGAIQVEGRFYCPQMPRALITASIDYGDDKISGEVYRDRIAARVAYEFRPNGKRGSDGSQRMLCPAAGTSPTVKCDRKPDSLKTPRPVPVVISTNRKGTSVPKVCAQATITLPREVGAKFKQEHRFGSNEWTALYRTGRSVNEGMNGIAKRGHPIDISNPNIRRVRGVAAQTILHAIQLMAVNFERIATFMQSSWRDPDQAVKNDRRRKRAIRSRAFSPRSSRTERSTGPPVLV